MRLGRQETPSKPQGRGRDLMRIAVSAAVAGFVFVSAPALALDKVTFGTNWLADPEAGG